MFVVVDWLLVVRYRPFGVCVACRHGVRCALLVVGWPLRAGVVLSFFVVVVIVVVCWCCRRCCCWCCRC